MSDGEVSILVCVVSLTVSQYRSITTSVSSLFPSEELEGQTAREEGPEYEISSSLLANQTAYNVSKLLDSLLHNYDNSLRPDFAGEHNISDISRHFSPGPSLLIEVNMQVRSMGPISEMDMVSPVPSYLILFSQSWPGQ